jgi:hypothetical protein
MRKYDKEKWHDRNPFISNILSTPAGDGGFGMDYA